MAHLVSHTGRAGLIAAALMLLSAPAMADSGAIQDPTGCATGSAVANCRSLPSTSSGSSGGSRLAPGKSQGLSNGDRLRKSTPLPSQQIQRSPQPLLPPPASTGLGGGSTGLGH